MVQLADTQFVTKSCRGSFVQTHVVFVTAHGDWLTAVSRQRSWVGVHSVSAWPLPSHPGQKRQTYSTIRESQDGIDSRRALCQHRGRQAQEYQAQREVKFHGENWSSTTRARRSMERFNGTCRRSHARGAGSHAGHEGVVCSQFCTMMSGGR